MATVRFASAGRPLVEFTPTFRGGRQEQGTFVIHRHVFHNEQLLPIEKVRLSPGQAGLICGWGIFTTVRIVQGEAFAYERHWRRLDKEIGRASCRGGVRYGLG